MTEQVIRQAALTLLARREHTQAELQAKLQAKGYANALVAAVLNDLVQEGALSDKRFVQMYIHSRAERGYGPLRIQAELQARHIDHDLMATCLDYTDPVWLQNAAKLVAKKTRATVVQDSDQTLHLKRFLQYRGFTSEQIKVSLAS